MKVEVKDMQIRPFAPKWYEVFNKWDWYAFIAIISILLLSFSIYQFNEEYANRFDFISALLGIIPTIPIVLILYVNRRKAWNSNLQKFLTVNYIYKGQKKLRAELIPLSGLTDIRAQAQTISRLFLTGERSNFSLKPALSRNYPSRTLFDFTQQINNGKPFELYEVDIELTEDATKHADFIKLDEPCDEGMMVSSQYPFTQTKVIPNNMKENY